MEVFIFWNDLALYVDEPKNDTSTHSGDSGT